MVNIILITQARMGSTRLPGKIFLKSNGVELLKIHLDRLSFSNKVSKIIVATTSDVKDDVVEVQCEKWGYKVFRGSEDDVLDRFYQASKGENADYIVRVTSDCPLIDPKLVDLIIDYTIEKKLDYCSNTLIEDYPDGQDIEVFRFTALKEAWGKATLLSEREHVTPYIKDNSTFKGGKLFYSDNFSSPKNFNHIRMTVDEKKDYELIDILVNSLGIDKTWREYVDYITEHDLVAINGNIVRNEGYYKSLAKENKI